MPTKPSNMAVEYARRQMSLRNTCGVCATQNMLRSGVPAMACSFTTFKVSMLGCPTTMPSASRLPFNMLMACVTMSAVTSGRAPSCTAITS